jgi:hypothetical protein
VGRGVGFGDLVACAGALQSGVTPRDGGRALQKKCARASIAPVLIVSQSSFYMTVMKQQSLGCLVFGVG